MTAEEFDRQFGPPMSSAATPEPLGDHHYDSHQARRFAARRYLDAGGGMARTFDQILHEGAKQMPEAQRAEFFRIAQRTFGPEHMEEVTIRLLAKHFTREQLEAMEAFYGTPEGRAIAARGVRISGPAIASEGPLDTPQDRRVAAQRYLFEVDAKRLYGELMRLAARRFPVPEESEAFLWRANRDYPDFERKLLLQMETYNTRSEIEAWRRFHTSEDGRAAMIRLPVLMDELSVHIYNVLQREMRRAKDADR